MIYKDEAFKIVGAAMIVHRELGCGFTEKVYQDALEIEFKDEDIPYQREISLHPNYRGKSLESLFVPDFICYDNIIVELKAVQELDDLHRAQAINYAKVANKRLAILINFGSTSLQFERFIV